MNGRNTEEERCVKTNGVSRGIVCLKNLGEGLWTEEGRSCMNGRNTEEARCVKRKNVSECA